MQQGKAELGQRLARERFPFIGEAGDRVFAAGEGLELRVQTDGKVRFDVGKRVKVHLPMDLCRLVLE